ncbi:MAG TPA: hypothetical protein PK802_04550 [Candidatus Cloacimonadota bacterium]|jgi:hypothetical protein|nr:hypothetical protein [Candidatus Cloacimonadota bacterium]HOF58977.1 hypothetical protein [Candidatus Cloacimonadota bacterium]HOR58223.1 hypothetical protein [Candidatus Cloacimonadota bacterium]HPB08938.1 hypothetical protein [Candidatus Cloacimonadota bacterium]HPL22718.1 hypothetical protein [Candidatus Cloacimonadota bacterium]
MRTIIAFLFLLPLALGAATLHVSLDGTQQYSVIQSAINDAVSGDVVLVHPADIWKTSTFPTKAA